MSTSEYDHSQVRSEEAVGWVLDIFAEPRGHSLTFPEHGVFLYQVLKPEIISAR
jgi:hypothetical protein